MQNDIVVRVVRLRIRRDGIQQGSIAVVRSLTGCATAAPPPLEEIPLGRVSNMPSSDRKEGVEVSNLF